MYIYIFLTVLSYLCLCDSSKRTLVNIHTTFKLTKPNKYNSEKVKSQIQQKSLKSPKVS